MSGKNLEKYFDSFFPKGHFNGDFNMGEFNKKSPPPKFKYLTTMCFFLAPTHRSLQNGTQNKPVKRQGPISLHLFRGEHFPSDSYLFSAIKIRGAPCYVRIYQDRLRRFTAPIASVTGPKTTTTRLRWNGTGGFGRRLTGLGIKISRPNPGCFFLGILIMITGLLYSPHN